MKKLMIALALVFAITASPAYAGEGGGYRKDKCGVVIAGEGGGYAKDKCGVTASGDSGGY